MWQGQVEAIYIATAKGEPMQSVATAEIVAGVGITGDRYFERAGTFSKKEGPERELTLIESEAIEAVRRDGQISLEASQTRRNIVTCGIALNHLVGEEFYIGTIRLLGIRLCEPCQYLEKKIGQPGLLQALLHRGGLRAACLSGGTIQPGERIAWQRSE